MSHQRSRRNAMQRIASASVGISITCLTGGRADDSLERGIVRVTCGVADLVVPHDGERFRYGAGYVFQAGPTQAGLLCNLRTEGYPVGDFEARVDAIVFDNTARISSASATPITRSVKYADRVTGAWRVVVKHGAKGGFVPLGARRSDGSPAVRIRTPARESPSAARGVMSRRRPSHSRQDTRI